MGGEHHKKKKVRVSKGQGDGQARSGKKVNF